MLRTQTRQRPQISTVQKQLTPKVLLIILSLASALTATAIEPSKVFDLWPGTPPGEKGDIGPEKDTTKPTDNLIDGKPLIRLGNVSKPTISIFPAPAGKANGSAVIVSPGGGYHILAWDLEGTEVCEWLNSIGVTAVLLKYRVPKRAEVEKHVPALQDAQRAISLVRHQAAEFGIDPKRVGVLGFSAGGHLSAALSTSTKRSYPEMDDADKMAIRPDFAILIYPGYLSVKELGDKPPPEIQVTTNTPPTFLTMTQDDGVRVENVIHYFLTLKQAGVPTELHVYPKGGHGYGLRRTKDDVTSWPDRAADWMRSNRWLERR